MGMWSNITCRGTGKEEREIKTIDGVLLLGDDMKPIGTIASISVARRTSQELPWRTLTSLLPFASKPFVLWNLDQHLWHHSSHISYLTQRHVNFHLQMNEQTLPWLNILSESWCLEQWEMVCYFYIENSRSVKDWIDVSPPCRDSKHKCNPYHSKN